MFFNGKCAGSWVWVYSWMWTESQKLFNVKIFTYYFWPIHKYMSGDNIWLSLQLRTLDKRTGNISQTKAFLPLIHIMIFSSKDSYFLSFFFSILFLFDPVPSLFLCISLKALASHCGVHVVFILFFARCFILVPFALCVNHFVRNLMFKSTLKINLIWQRRTQRRSVEEATFSLLRYVSKEDWLVCNILLHIHTFYILLFSSTSLLKKNLW